MSGDTVVNYRALYEQSVCMLAFNIMKDISALLTTHEEIDFQEGNRFKFDGQIVKGVFLIKDGVFIKLGSKKFEVSEDNETFIQFSQEPYNFIKLYESVTNELKNT